jgi:hypothetical protein
MHLAVDTFLLEVYIHIHRRNSKLHDKTKLQNKNLKYKKFFDKSGKETIETYSIVCSIFIVYVKTTRKFSS